jgi:hypothetical protein
MEPRNRFQRMNSASLCSLVGGYDNPIPTRFLAPIDCLKIPALEGNFKLGGGGDCWMICRMFRRENQHRYKHSTSPNKGFRLSQDIINRLLHSRLKSLRSFSASVKSIWCNDPGKKGANISYLIFMLHYRALCMQRAYCTHQMLQLITRPPHKI